MIKNTLFNRLKRKILEISLKNTPKSISKKINFGIIGAGNVAFWKYLPAIKTTDGVKFIGAYDCNSVASQKLCNALGGTPYMSAEKLLQDPQIDAVFICSPPETHFTYLITSLMHNKHVLCEKPMASNLTEAKEAETMLNKTPLIGMINYSFRSCPEWILIFDLLRSGIIGNVHNVVGQISQGGWFDANYAPSKQRNDASDWRYHPGGGVIKELGSHLIDMCLWLFGDVVNFTSEEAYFGIQDNPSEDICGFLMKFASGALAQVQVSRLATGYKEYCHFEISGQKGAIKNLNGKIFLWLHEEPYWQELLVPRVPSNQFLLTFVDAINHHKKDYPSFKDGLKVWTILEPITKDKQVEENENLSKRSNQIS